MRNERQNHDQTTEKFMKLVDDLKEQQMKKEYEFNFRNNYRKKSLDPAKRQYKSSNFLKPTGNPSETNLLTSSNAFRGISQ